jgi:hypothetical protein
MLRPYRYDDAEAFLKEFTAYMQNQYSDLIVLTAPTEKMIGDKTCLETDYTYKVSGYDVKDRRIAIPRSGRVYLFTSKEIEANGMTVGSMLEDVVADCVFLGEEEVVAHQVIKAAGEVVEAGFTQAAVNGRGVLDSGFVGFGLGVYLLDDAIGGWGEDGAPGVEGENTEPDVNAREDDIAYGLERGVVDEVVDGHGCTDADRQPLDTTGEAHREVVFVGVGLLAGIADGVAYLLGHAHGAPEVDEEDKRGGGLYPRYDGGGEHGEAEGRRQQQGQQEGGGEVKQVVERRMLLAGEEVALAHD